MDRNELIKKWEDRLKVTSTTAIGWSGLSCMIVELEEKAMKWDIIEGLFLEVCSKAIESHEEYYHE